MFALGIRYLTGVAVATDRGDRSSVEWPPHPGRVFMAMTAAWGETGRDAAEGEALRSLERLGSPDGIYASEAHVRRPVEFFVPVNDTVPSKAAEFGKAGTLQSAPSLRRVRASRYFPAARPDDDRVFLIWKSDLDADAVKRIRNLCGKVTRIGHSSSLVQMWVEDAPPRPTWEQSDTRAETRLRAIHPGLFDRLQAHHDRAPRNLPTVSMTTGYGRAGHPTVDAAGTVWSPDITIVRLVPLESSFRRLDLVSTLRLTDVLHRAAVAMAGSGAPEALTGRAADGSPTDQPHLALLPLPFAGHRKADGEVRGIGLALPRDLSLDERHAVLRAVMRAGALGSQGNGGLTLGRLGRWELSPDIGDPPIETLRASAWTGGRRGAEVWGSVTPIVFDRHPKSDGAAYIEEVSNMMTKACTRIGLPEPARVDPLPVSVHPGVPASHEFPRMKRKNGSQRRHLHARLVFSEPVQGPIAIGAGRFRGYGLFRPVRGGGHG